MLCEKDKLSLELTTFPFFGTRPNPGNEELLPEDQRERLAQDRAMDLWTSFFSIQSQLSTCLLIALKVSSHPSVDARRFVRV